MFEEVAYRPFPKRCPLRWPRHLRGLGLGSRGNLIKAFVLWIFRNLISERKLQIHQLFKKIQIIYVVVPNLIMGLVPSFRKGSLPTNFRITNFSFFLLHNFCFTPMHLQRSQSYSM